jgi:hypothetical protein
MPALSLVVCIYKERTLLKRLLREASGCYDDVIVVHDGPEEGEGRTLNSVEDLITKQGGRAFVGPRSFQQEPHWSFAWRQAKHDWILRLDADEVPSIELRKWLKDFRNGPEPDAMVSGYTCIWPLWDGRQMVTRHWPAGRIFLFHKERVRFFGMVEQVPVPDGRFEPLPLILEHRPERKSYGLRNVLLRPQAYHWRRVIAQSLLGEPTSLACWRWTSNSWPLGWQQIRSHPIRTALWRLLAWPLQTTVDIWRKERKFMPIVAAGSGIHHFLICITYWQARWHSKNQS